MITTSDFRKGMKIEHEGEPYSIIDFVHYKPGKGGAFVRATVRNLLSNKIIEITWRSGEKVKKPDLDERMYQYLYSDGDDAYHFMDNGTYEQITLNGSQIENAKDFMKENENYQIMMFNGKAISVEPPTFMELLIAKAEPGLRGDTATAGTKPAILETGKKIQVPLFVNEGEVVKVDTRTAEYLERV
ncbi:elongation factor P [Desulfurispirillum indicum]|uniref:Elongation factor P n=1 Tax=Desulfurispirillum indicum (strain ATCC BAA-1389 / DSM 22839 / S5) TaxID=653733 RepID=E6W7E3_DESIS|nr:elongation factor P [Desulfurispirillum indicum]ADU66310.1 translation elongation factor P [Desulfurispirillum indicum S5]UCZ55644.1 elongation factor P [Desulfurispirillum indicum]